MEEIMVEAEKTKTTFSLKPSVVPNRKGGRQVGGFYSAVIDEFIASGEQSVAVQTEPPKNASSISQGLRKALGNRLEVRIALIGDEVFMERRTAEEIALAESRREQRKMKRTLNVVEDILDAANDE
jgi:hypothetical protein